MTVSASEVAISNLSPLPDRSRLADQAVQAPLSNEEQKEISRRLRTNLLGAGLLGVGLLVEHIWANQQLIGLMLQGLAALTVAFPIFVKAVRGFLSVPSTDLTEQLVALAVLAAIASGDFVSAALVPLFLEIGHLFEERSALGAQASIQRLRDLCSRKATVWHGEEEREVAPETLNPGDIIIVRPGELVPVDGIITRGRASMDQASVTGESNPEDVGPDDEVFAGTTNLDGMLHVKVQSSGEATVLGRVVTVLQEVEQAKTPIVRLLERVAVWYLPTVIVLAGITLFLSSDLSRFITVLIVACPCALVLAAPSAMVASMARATRHSILIKNAAFLEEIGRVDTLILDKTGTVTDGEQSVNDVIPAGAQTEKDLLSLAAAAAHGSRHPASRAIANLARAQSLVWPDASEVREVPGCGVEAVVGDDIIRIGRRSWLIDLGIEVPELGGVAKVTVAQSSQFLGSITLADHARPEAEPAIQTMRSLGFDKVILLSGDKSEIANEIGHRLGVDEIVSEALPQDKLEIVRREQSAERQVLMVGDGVNDALALSASDVGIAIGAKVSEVALGGADVALLTADVGRLPMLVDIADRTRRIIFENVIIGVGFSVGMLTLAAFGVVSPLVGALLHNGGAIFVILNSSRLLRDPQETRLRTADQPEILSRPFRAAHP